MNRNSIQYFKIIKRNTLPRNHLSRVFCFSNRLQKLCPPLARSAEAVLRYGFAKSSPSLITAPASMNHLFNQHRILTHPRSPQFTHLGRKYLPRFAPCRLLSCFLRTIPNVPAPVQQPQSLLYPIRKHSESTSNFTNQFFPGEIRREKIDFKHDPT